MKRIISIITAMILLLSVTVSGVVYAKPEPSLEVSSAAGYVGDQVTINVSLKNSPGFGGIAYDVKYDNTKLKLISYSKDLGSSICTDSGMERYPDKMNFQYAGISNVEGDGILVSLTFELLDVDPSTTRISVIPEECTTFYYVDRTEVDFYLNETYGEITINKRPIPVTGFTLDKTTATVETGDETLTLTPIFSPNDATNKNLTWSSDNENVATVNDGVVTLIKKGVATITATTEDSGYTASCVVTINCSHRKVNSYPVESSTCIKQGHEAYDVCGECSMITSGSDALLPYGDHTGGTATCKNKAVCDVCHKIYGNYGAHLLTPHDRNEPDHFNTGNIQYWMCNTCEKYFSDSEGKDEISQADIILPKLTYEIRVQCSGNGSVLLDGIDKKTGYYEQGETATITATPKDGYCFDGWYEDGAKLSDAYIYSFSVTENQNIEARFIEQMTNLSFLDGEIQIEYANIYIPNGAEFRVIKVVPPPNDVVQKVKGQYGESSDVIAYYEIRLISPNGELTTKLNGKITISMKLSKEYLSNHSIIVLQEDESGKLIEMTSWIGGEYICYQTDWLEIY